LKRESQAAQPFSGGWVPVLLGSLLLLFLALPLIALTWRAIERLDRLDDGSRATVRDALVLTGLTSLISLLIILALGTPLALVLSRRRFPGQPLIDTLIDLPMVLPPAVAGLALLMAFGRRGLLGASLDDLGIRVGFTTTAVVLAQVFVASPFYVRAARGAFARIDRALEESAADLGAPPGAVFRTITIPLALPGLSAGAVLSWARAVGEFGATIMFAGNLPRETQTMPLAIYSRYESGDLESALTLALLLLVFSTLVLVSVRGIGGRLRYAVSD
jgi:molybdate transport system permease protein